MRLREAPLGIAEVQQRWVRRRTAVVEHRIGVFCTATYCKGKAWQSNSIANQSVVLRCGGIALTSLV